MRSLSKLGFLMMILTLALAACQPGSLPIDTPAEEPDAAPAAGIDLAGTDWTLSALDGALPLPGVAVTLRFGADGTVSGTDGCNQFSTTYTQDGSSLTITQPMASTMMACEEPVMNQAAGYMSALAATTGFLGGDRQLVLTTGDQILAAFVAGVDETGAATEGETSEPVAVGQLAGSNWTLSTLGGAAPLQNVAVTLTFGADGSASGSDGCNLFNLAYSEDGDSLTFQPAGISTMMACEDAIMAQAAAFTSALSATTTFSIADGQLTLSAGDQELATFAAVSSDLTDTAWNVMNYNNGREAVVSILLDTEITAYFDAEGMVTGNAGCNQYFTDFATDGNTISIGMPATSRRFCPEPEGVMEQESEYLAALQSAATYSIRGDLLEMRTAADQTAVVMSRQTVVDLPEPAPEPTTPTGTVTGAQSLNVRSGPGTAFPVIGVARSGDTGEIVGRSADGGWWVIALPPAPGGVGWVSASFVTATNADDVPVVPSPPLPPTPTPRPATPTPAPTVTPIPLATPTAEIAFWANRTTIEQGQCTTLNWSVQNVQAVWVYPQGEVYSRFPRAGQGNEIVCPPGTTTYEMRVQMRDGSTQFRQVTVTVNPAPPPPAANPLSGTRWDVVNYNNGSQAVVTLIGGTSISMNFGADGQVTGTAGCNSYFAFYQVNGNNITVGQPGATSLFCAEPAGVMDQEAQFLAALQSAARFSINGNTLEMRTAGDQIAVVAARAP